MKIRIFKKEDGTVIYNWPSQKYQDRLDECKIPDALKDFPHVVMNEEELPSLSSPNEYIEMLYFDGEFKKENLKADREWNICLMPTFLIKSKHIKKINEDIDIELQKEVSDSIEIAKLQREREKCQIWTNKEWFQQALVNLDELVAGGESDKPLIRQKLQEKIQELSDAPNSI